MDNPMMAALIRSADRLQTVKYTIVASNVALLFDYFLTFSSEVDFIWTSKWNVGKVSFLISRYTAILNVPVVFYYNLAPHIPLKACHALSGVNQYSTAIGICVAEAIMILRTYGLWGNNRKLLIFLSTLVVAIFIPVLIIVALFLRSMKYGEPPPLSTFVGCLPIAGNMTILLVNFAMLIGLEITITTLTIWIGVKRYRHSRNPLIHTLYRDGIFFFIYTLLASAGNIIVLVAGPPEYIDLLNPFQRVMHSILSTRIMLHVRAAARSHRESRYEEQSSAAHMSLAPLASLEQHSR